MGEELAGIKTQTELEEYWESKDLLTREIIDIKTHYPNAIDSEALRFLHKKNVVFVKETKQGNEACIAYLKEMGCFCAQGETKRAALDDLLEQLIMIMPYEQDYVRFVNIISLYEELKNEKDYTDIINIIASKYSIKDNLEDSSRERQNDIFV